jgi:hypothetical protein
MRLKSLARPCAGKKETPPMLRVPENTEEQEA